MKVITYFSGAHSGGNPSYVDAAKAVGNYIGSRKCITKFGGSRRGLMGAYCASVKEAAIKTGSGAQIFGYVPKKFININEPEKLGIEFTITETLTERKQMLLEGADAFIVMPGGIGTLDEIYETIEQDYVPADNDPTNSIEYAIRPIFVLNLNYYYDATIEQLEQMEREGFLIPQKIATLYFYNTTDELIAALDRFFES
ncbi:MAG: LOG family protein [Alphaproteobacteria bacterium]|jgi:uncharacterized protein (TIGR00730 family)|nr:LOG family protein [Alphaproteobacteria bacterium]